MENLIVDDFMALYSGIILPDYIGSESTTVVSLFPVMMYSDNPGSNFSLSADNQLDKRRFEGSEHRTIGSQVTLNLENNKKIDGNELLIWAGNAAIVKKGDPVERDAVWLTYGDIMALGGDFYGIPDKPICKNGQEGFSKAFRTLLSSSITELKAIIEIMRIEKNMVFHYLEEGGIATEAFKLLSNASNARWDLATRDGSTNISFAPYYSTADWKKIPNEFSDSDYKSQMKHEGLSQPSSLGRYTKLAKNNIDHFGLNALLAYTYGHGVALEWAAKNAKSDDGLKMAYAMNAFADHFLSDLFSSGHLRVPRVYLNEGLWQQQACSKNMHDEDSKWGLCVTNRAGHKWRCFGDSMYFTEKNTANSEMLKLAIQASADDIYDAYKNKVVIDSSLWKVTQYIPYSYAINDYNPNPNDLVNFSPLFIVGETENLQRKDINNLDDRHWSSHFRYFDWDIFGNPDKYHPNPPENYPLPPTSKPKLHLYINDDKRNLIGISDSSIKIRFSLVFVWTFNNFTGVNQSSDPGPWSEWRSLNYIEFGNTFTVEVCLDNDIPDETFSSLRLNPNFVGYNFLCQIGDEEGKNKIIRLCGESTPGKVIPLRSKESPGEISNWAKFNFGMGTYLA